MRNGNDCTEIELMTNQKKQMVNQEDRGWADKLCQDSSGVRVNKEESSDGTHQHTSNIRRYKIGRLGHW